MTAVNSSKKQNSSTRCTAKSVHIRKAVAKHRQNMSKDRCVSCGTTSNKGPFLNVALAAGWILSCSHRNDMDSAKKTRASHENRHSSLVPLHRYRVLVVDRRDLGVDQNHTPCDRRFVFSHVKPQTLVTHGPNRHAKSDIAP